MERTDFEQWKAREVARLLALVETERRYYQEMVATLPVALVVLSSDRSIVSANRAFRQTFGVRSGELQRKTVEQIIPSAHLIERIRDTHMQGCVQPDLYLDVDGRPLRIAILPIRNWNDEGELETLLMVEDLSVIRTMLPAIGHPPAPSVQETEPEAIATEAIVEPALEPLPLETSPIETPPTAESVVEESCVEEPIVDEPVVEEPASVAPEPIEEPSEVAAAPAVTPVADTPIFDKTLPAVLWRADATNFQFTAVWGAAEQLLGYPVSHWLSSPQFFRERIHPEDRAAAMLFYETALTRPGDASSEFRAVTASGRVRWCRETIRVPEFDDASGSITSTSITSTSITGVLTDITLRKQLEEQLLAAERHDALHTLTSRLAHDLNNPLMIITGYSEEMLHALPAGDLGREDVEQILRATERISGITSHLLAFTRRFANPPRPIEVGLLLSAMELHFARAAGPDVMVELAGSSEPVWAAADPGQLEEILLALVSSAREDAQERSRVTIGWELDSISEQLPEATLKPGTYARILVHDNGRGVDVAKRVTVFESVLAGKDPEKSAGPELARAYAMIREWEGDIAFASDPFRGSTFMVYLPVPRIAAPPVPDVEVPVAIVEEVIEPVEAPTARMRETILLVEDESGIRALVRKILSRERYRVLEASTGEEALNLAGTLRGAIQLLVTDVMLPGIGGREIAETMRASNPNLRVLYVSGYTDDEAVRAGWFPPGSMFLQKPFTLTALVTKVRESLDANKDA